MLSPPLCLPLLIFSAIPTILYRNKPPAPPGGSIINTPSPTVLPGVCTAGFFAPHLLIFPLFFITDKISIVLELVSATVFFPLHLFTTLPPSNSYVTYNAITFTNDNPRFSTYNCFAYKTYLQIFFVILFIYHCQV